MTSKWRAGVPVKIAWKGGVLTFEGAAQTEFLVPDELYEEVNADFVSTIPGFEWTVIGVAGGTAGTLAQVLTTGNSTGGTAIIGGAATSATIKGGTGATTDPTLQLRPGVSPAGGAVVLTGGEGGNSGAGGSISVTGGSGHIGTYKGAALIAGGATSTADGKVAITTDGSAGASGEALVSDGAGSVVWGAVSGGTSTHAIDGSYHTGQIGTAWISAVYATVLSGVVPIASIPTGETSATVSIGTHTHAAGASGVTVAEIDGSPASSVTRLEFQNGSVAVSGSTATVKAATPEYGGLETVSTIASAGASSTIDLANGNVFDITLDAATCTLTFSGATSGKACSMTIIAHQDSAGSRTITWPGSVVWAVSTPILGTTASAVNVLTFLTTDGGTTWRGFEAATTNPYPVFSGAILTKSVTQSISTVAVAVSFDGEVLDTDSYHDNATNNTRLTAPATGYYLAGGSVELLAIADQKSVITRIRKNGTDASGDGRARAYASGTSLPAMPFSRPISMTAGDYIELIVEQNDTTTEIVRDSSAGGTSFWIIRVG